MQQILGVYLDPVVAASAARHEIVMDELLDGGAHTLLVKLAGPVENFARVATRAEPYFRGEFDLARERLRALEGP